MAFAKFNEFSKKAKKKEINDKLDTADKVDDSLTKKQNKLFESSRLRPENKKTFESNIKSNEIQDSIEEKKLDNKPKALKEKLFEGKITPEIKKNIESNIKRKEVQDPKEEFLNSISDDEILELSKDLPENMTDYTDENFIEYTEDEIKELYEQDPGYVNDHVRYEYGEIKTSLDNKVYAKAIPLEEVLDKEGNLKKEFTEYSEYYKRTGKHLPSWGEDAVKDTKEIAKMEEGSFFDRWGEKGKTDGHYFAVSGTNYEDLQLNVSKDKREKTQYRVLKSFDVEKSVIKKQPFSENEYKSNTVQFYSKKGIDQLTKEGYIEPFNLPKDKDSKDK